jgi:hypothetical protein
MNKETFELKVSVIISAENLSGNERLEAIMKLYDEATPPASKEPEQPRTFCQLCPKCNGQGIVSKPPYIAGDVHEWASASITFTCDVCNGAKVLYATPQPVEQLSDEGIEQRLLSMMKENPSRLINYFVLIAGKEVLKAHGKSLVVSNEFTENDTRFAVRNETTVSKVGELAEQLSVEGEKRYRWVKASERLGEFKDSEIPEWKFFNPDFCCIDGKATLKSFFRKDTEKDMITFFYKNVSGVLYSAMPSEFHRITWLEETTISPDAEKMAEGIKNISQQGNQC